MTNPNITTAPQGWATPLASANPQTPIPQPPQTAEQVAYEHMMALEAQGRLSKYMKLPDVPESDMPVKRRVFQPRFKLHLETIHDVSLRLMGTVVYVGSKAYIVKNCVSHEKDYLLVICDHTGKMFKVMYSNPSLDLRNPEPQYIVYGDAPSFLSRRPYRQQKQGLCYENSLLKPVNGTRFFRPDGLLEVIRALTSCDTQQWQTSYYDFLVKLRACSSLRLSPHIAVYRKGETNELHAEYKGRYLGEVQEDTITVDETDFQKPWINRDIQLVGCKIRSEA